MDPKLTLDAANFAIRRAQEQAYGLPSGSGTLAAKLLAAGINRPVHVGTLRHALGSVLIRGGERLQSAPCPA